MRERRRRLATDDGGGFVDQCLVFDGGHHEQSEVHTAREVAFPQGITHMPTPRGQAMALVVQVGEASEPRAGRRRSRSS